MPFALNIKYDLYLQACDRVMRQEIFQVISNTQKQFFVLCSTFLKTDPVRKTGTRESFQSHALLSNSLGYLYPDIANIVSTCFRVQWLNKCCFHLFITLSCHNSMENYSPFFEIRIEDQLNQHM